MFGVGVLTGASLSVSQTHSLGRFSGITKNVPRQVLMLFDYSVQTLHGLEFLLCQNLLRAGYGSPSLWGTCKSWGCSRLCQLAEGPGGPAGSQGWLECRHPQKHPFSRFLLTGRLEPAPNCQSAIRCNLCLAVLGCPRGAMLEVEFDLRLLQ